MVKVALWVVAAFVALFVLLHAGRKPAGQSAPTKEEVSRAEYLKAVADYEAQQQKAAQSWVYSDATDKMSGKPIKFADIHSSNEFSLGPPYEGAQRATLRLRTHPRFGKDVMLSISRGQFMCTSSDCSVTARFDDGKPLTFTANEPADHSSNMLFIDNHDRFVAGARKARRLLIEVRFFREGNRTMEFDVQGLKW